MACSVIGCIRGLGGDPHLIAAVLRDQTQAGLCLPVGIHPGGVEVTDAAVDRGVDDLHGLFIERMEEPAPPAGFLAAAPEYGDADSIPRLMMIRARKVE